MLMYTYFAVMMHHTSRRAYHTPNRFIGTLVHNVVPSGPASSSSPVKTTDHDTTGSRGKMHHTEQQVPVPGTPAYYR